MIINVYFLCGRTLEMSHKSGSVTDVYFMIQKTAYGDI